jgi:hypothetical protein
MMRTRVFSVLDRPSTCGTRDSPVKLAATPMTSTGARIGPLNRTRSVSTRPVGLRNHAQQSEASRSP